GRHEPQVVKELRHEAGGDDRARPKRSGREHDVRGKKRTQPLVSKRRESLAFRSPERLERRRIDASPRALVEIVAIDRLVVLGLFIRLRHPPARPATAIAFATGPRLLPVGLRSALLVFFIARARMTRSAI